MALKDLREYIEALEKNGDLIRIKEEVDWNLEAAAMTRKSNETWGSALLFEKVKDYPEGFRLLGGPIATFRRLAIAMGLKPDASYTEIQDEFMERISHPIKPLILSSGPCKEVIMKGDEVDLFRLPAPMIHDGDGGRFIGTWNVGVCKDPYSDWVNWGTYRLMIHDRNSTGVFVIPAQHIGMIYGKYEERNQSMEYAAFIGAEPLNHVMAITGIPYGVSEVDVAGGLRKEPVELVKCETVDLYVPATSEIVLEGEVLPHERKDEGPFGEYPGYQMSGRVKRPIFKVKAITFRQNPIITFSCIGVPVDEGNIVTAMGMAVEFKKILLEAGFPITGVYVPPEGAIHLCVVGTKTPYPHIATRIASAIWGHKMGFAVPKIIVVDDDIDPTNMTEVIHAFATKSHPREGTFLIEKAHVSVLTGFLGPEERKEGSGACVVYDCTWPKDWPPEAVPPRSSFRAIYPKEVQERAIEKLKRIGFKL